MTQGEDGRPHMRSETSGGPGCARAWTSGFGLQDGDREHLSHGLRCFTNSSSWERGVAGGVGPKSVAVESGESSIFF